MIGSGLKKLANENGMTVARGVAYGSLRGYAATMSEGAGWKQITFATSIPDAQQKTAFMDAVGAVDVTKLYRVQKLGINPKAIQINFLDNPGTMKKIYAFLDWFLPLLEQYGATGVNVCTECGFEVTGGKWVLINGIAYHLHDGCAQKVKREIEATNEAQKDNAEGSYLTGALGAFGGAALGAVIWAVVLLMGYVASLVGLAIGWLAEKGYTLLKGKPGKAKVVILILAVAFGVVAGTLAADVFYLAKVILSGEWPGFVLADIPLLMAINFGNPEYLSGTVKNVVMGLLFAALGVFALLRQTGREVSGTSYAELN